MKRILIFSLNYYPKYIGGAEVAIKEITDRLSCEAFEFDMVTLRFDSSLPEYERIGNINIHRIGFSRKEAEIKDLSKFPLFLNKIYFQFGATIKAFSLHRKKKYDAIWAMMAHSCGVPALFFKLLLPNIRFILTLQEGDPPEYIKKKMGLIYPIFKQSFIRADIIQVISNFLGNWARDMGYRGDIEVIPNAVDTKYFSNVLSGEELTSVKEIVGIKEGDIFLITTSRLVKKNGVDDVIRSLVYLPENIKFAILGIGPDFDYLEGLVKKLSLGNRVVFLGQVEHSLLPKYLWASDIFIRPSLSEGMGNSFIEAMAAGLPVIATQEGGIADFLYDPEINKDKKPTGRAVKVRDPEDIARQVKNYLNDKDMTEEIIKNAKDMVFERYDWSRIAKLMDENVFSKI